MISRYIQPQRISVFMPQRMSDEDIELLFVVRKDVLDALVTSLNNENPTSIPQHHLLIGQRGMGKTTLLKRLDIELRKPGYRERFIPFTFPEEQYNIDRLSKFWLNSLDALADTIQEQGDTALAFQLDDQISTLSLIRDEQQLSNKAYNLLKQTTQDLNRRPVFLLDNLNLIFERLGEQDQSRLRKLISEPGAPIFIGASAAPIDDTVDYSAPFYDAFDVHYLSKLDFAQTLLVLRHLAQITNQTELQSQLNEENMSRLKTLHELTGGNVRTVIILFSLVAQGFSADVFLDLEALIDQMTPLYKARFEELSKQAQVIVDAVALNWDPINLETLREKTYLENSQLSAQLDRLLKAGWFNKLGKRKSGTYEVSERFFNVWYLMRRSSRRQRRDLLWLTRFLQAWFTKTELRKRAEEYTRLVSDKCHPHEISFGLALARASEGKRAGKKLLEKTYKRLIELYDADTEKIEQVSGVDLLEINPEWIINFKNEKILNYMKKARLLAYNNKFLEAENVWKESIRAVPDYYLVWLGLGDLYQYGLNQYDKAEQAYKKVIELDSKEVLVWNRLGNLYWSLDRFHEAEQMWKKATELAPNSAHAWTRLGDLYHYDLNYYEAAEQSYEKSIELEPNNGYIWSSLGRLNCCKLKKFDKAEHAYRYAIELDGGDSRPWHGLGHLYHIHLGRYEEAEQAYERALAIEPDDADSWFGLTNLYHIYLEDYLKAEQLYKRAIELVPDDDRIWAGVADLYQYKLEQDEEAEQAYKRVIEISPDNNEIWGNLGNLYRNTGRYVEAEQAWKKASELEPHDVRSLISLGDLYQYGLKRYEDAEKVYKTVLEIETDEAWAWYGLGNVYYELRHYTQAENAYRNVLALDQIDITSNIWNRLGILYMDHLDQYHEAEKAFRKALEEQDESTIFAKANLVFLLRDQLNNYNAAKQLFEASKQEYADGVADTSLLHEASFESYNKNWGLASDYWKKALELVSDTLPSSTVDDWYRSAAVAVRLKYGEDLLAVFESTGHNRIFRPLYEAIKAYTLKNPEEYLASEVAAEVRDVASQILAHMQSYNKAAKA